MKTARRIMCFLTGVLCFGAAAIADEVPVEVAARQQADRMLREVQINLTLEQYKQVRGEAFKAELDLRLAAATVNASPESADRIQAELDQQKRKVLLLRATAGELEQRFRELVHEQMAGEREVAEAGEREASRWQGHAKGNPDLVMIVEVEGREGEFVVEGDGERVAGRVRVTGNACDFEVRDTTPGAGKYAGKTALGVWRERDGALAVVLNEPGRPERPEKLELDGNPHLKGFLLHRD